MNKFLKYVLVVNLSFIIFSAIVLLLHPVFQDSSIVSGGIIKALFEFISIYTIGVGFPLFAVILSGIYQYKNPNFREYGKSLLITFSFVILFCISIPTFLFLNGRFEGGLSMEGGQFLVIIGMISIAIFISSAIINLATLFVSRHFLKK
ncbi:MAG: hypothetical protein COU71_02980 [Parcubacteria group bacterium CG10_big_fil_rev_8_21_14_0_10_38_31]|nr:MAG: hypothetical protein COU71_02980 [Parcubacteria group bacterium CG10_big_fil_rev_8_21_14_0_10_38_31]